MTKIPMKRTIPVFLLVVVACLWLMLGLVAKFDTRSELSLESEVFMHTGFAIACLCMTWLAVVRHTVMTVGGGYLAVPSWFGGLKVPVQIIQEARIVRVGADAFLEVQLTEVPEVLRPRLNTFMKRRLIRNAKHMRWRPPEEPYILVSVPPPDCDDAMLAEWIDAERRATREDAAEAGQ